MYTSKSGLYFRKVLNSILSSKVKLMVEKITLCILVPVLEACFFVSSLFDFPEYYRCNIAAVMVNEESA